MTISNVAAPLAAALADKGYETLTPVQNAVLGEELIGRDLLVSAQTGSGKTVAFGLAIAPELLASDLSIAAIPRALIIAPTRELALQVHRELEWLYGPSGAKIASCVGGMDPRNERRTLERGASIVVGTPGRLRDHIERGSLDLSDLRAAVLDEADEMLDLGFQDDLEYILGQAPEERRTLMFSATVSKEIESLASNYQRESVRVQVAGQAKQHLDITYKAMNVAQRDKENAVINLLLLQQARVAIVFAKTRAAVTHLHARMANRGFKVVALSGELSQGERTHALQALRDGRAQVCIATDVAARGIDLPGLDLVIHFDLPSNPETLLHRSGRTGRAGAKGTAVLVVAPADFRKASRILQGAKINAEWVKAPTAEEVQSADDARMLNADILLDAVTEDETALVEAILGVATPEQTAAAFLRMWRQGRSAPEIVGDAPVPQAAGEARPPRAREEFGPSVWFSLSVGHEGRAEARWLLPKICDGAGITRNDIGAIRVQTRETFVQIAEAQAAKLGQSLELEEGLIAVRMAEAPNLERPERAPRPGGKPFGKSDRPQGGARKPRDFGGEERRPFTPRSSDGDRPARPRREDGDRKPWAGRDDGDRKPWAGREDSDRKPFARREDGDRKPWAAREDGDRPRKAYNPDDASAERKPRWKPEDRAERGPREDKPFARREDGDRKPFARRDDGDRKPWAKDGERKSFGDRKPFGKRDDGDRKPWAKREDGDRPRKSFGDDKPRGSFGAAPKPNFSDASVSLRGKPRTGGAPKGGKSHPKGGFKPKF